MREEKSIDVGPTTKERVKSQAKSLYQAWLRHCDFRERPQQLEMIDTMVDAILSGDPKVVLIEAGTGTGKTVVYLVVMLSLLKLFGDETKVVVVTNTVALQDQLMRGELPQLAEVESFTYAAAKGRQRYACTYRVQKEMSRSALTLPVKGERQDTFENRCSQLFDLLAQEQWNGDLDVSPISFNIAERQKITTNARGCTRDRCEYYRQCPYYGNRDQWQRADVVVTNYNLLLLDLHQDLGILPHPNNTFYVFDEAHNLHSKFMLVHAQSTNFTNLLELCKQIANFVRSFTRHWRAKEESPINEDLVNRELQALAEAVQVADTRLAELEFQGDPMIFRFAYGSVSEEVRDVLHPVANWVKVVAGVVRQMNDKVSEVITGEYNWLSLEFAHENRQQLIDCADEIEGTENVVTDWCRGDESGSVARWLRMIRHEDRSHEINLSSVPIAVDELLQQDLWRMCRGAACVSATLGGYDAFDGLKTDLGLPPSTRGECIPSPFEPENVRFRVPAMDTQPTDNERYTYELAAKLPSWLNEHQSGLVIFTSGNSMRNTWKNLDRRFRNSCLMQYDYQSGEELLKKHKTRIEAGQKSYVFGLATFREGVDLPGRLCEQVVIAQLPFPVPTDPILQARKERMFPEEPSSFPAWMHFDLSEAILLLAQTCGRLIRHEDDTGTITIADTRIKTKRYAKQMQSVLPYALEGSDL